MENEMEVCLIEDDMIQVFLTRKFLGRIEVVEKIVDYHNGKEAYEALKRRSEAGERMPDIIFLDLNMPVWDGWDFYEAFLELPESKTVDTYILTSSLDHSDMSKAEEFGLKEKYLSKPVSLPQLKKIIAK